MAPPAVQTDVSSGSGPCEARRPNPMGPTSLLDSTSSSAPNQRPARERSANRTGQRWGRVLTLIQRIAPIEYPKSDDGVDSESAAATVDCGRLRFRDRGAAGQDPGRSQVGHGRSREDRPNATLPGTPLTRPLTATWRSTSRPAPYACPHSSDREAPGSRDRKPG